MVGVRLACRRTQSCDPGSTRSHDPAPPSSRRCPTLQPPPVLSTSRPSHPSLSSLNISQRAHWSSTEAAGGCLGCTKAALKQNIEVALAHPRSKDCIVSFIEMFYDTSTVEAFRLMRFRRATKFFLIFKIWDTSLIVLVWASFESSGIMFILVWILHHLLGSRFENWIKEFPTWHGLDAERLVEGRFLFSSLLLWRPKVGQTSEVNSKVKIGENKQEKNPGL